MQPTASNAPPAPPAPAPAAPDQQQPVPGADGALPQDIWGDQAMLARQTDCQFTSLDGSPLNLVGADPNQQPPVPGGAAAPAPQAPPAPMPPTQPPG